MRTIWDGRIQGESHRIPLQDESVHMVVTSPPYWSLRKYDIPPSVWGGAPDCQHEWDCQLVRGGSAGRQGNNSHRTGRTNVTHQSQQGHPLGSFCQKCVAWLGQLGLEPVLDLYMDHMLSVFDEVWRVLRKDGTCWVNLGDSYAGSWGAQSRENPGPQGTSTLTGGSTLSARQIMAHPHSTGTGSTKKTPGLKPKDLCGIPFRFALAMQARGWYWRSTIVWAKTNCMPGSQKDRPTSSWEPLFLFAKSSRYFYDYVAVMEPVTGNSHSRGTGAGPKTIDEAGQHRNNLSFSTAVKDVAFARNRRDVWSIPSQPFSEAHYACYPEDLVEPCILAGTSQYGCCAECSAPYRRLVEKQTYGDWHGNQDLKKDGVNRNHANGSKWRKMQEQDSARRMIDNVQSARDAGGDHDQPFLPPKTIGWERSCECSTDDRVPAIVLDPFLGSGTTAGVSERLSRRWVGLDLGYQDMQARRLRNIQKVLV